VNLLAFKVKEFSLIHSILFAIFPVLFLYSVNISPLPFQSFILPLLLVVSFAGLFWVILRAVLKNSYKAGFIVSTLLFIFLMFYHFVNVLSQNESNDFGIIPQHLAIIFIIIFSISTYFFVRTKRKLDNATKITNGIAIALVLLVLINIGMFHVELNSSLSATAKPQEGILVSANENPPDVYYILLDGHTNPIIAKKFLDYDDQEFVKFLKEKEFYIPSHYTNSNFKFTRFSILTTLHMNFWDQFIKWDSKEEPPNFILYSYIDQNEVMHNFKSMGYNVISFDSGWWGTNKIDMADENLCENTTVDWILIRKIKNTTLLPALDFLDDYITDNLNSHTREQILCELSELATVRDHFEGPIFVFTHIIAIHEPFIFEANGEPIKEFVTPSYYDYSENFENRTKAYFKQLKFIDSEIQKIIEKILADTEREKIIIIQSDHGARLVPKGSTPEEEKVIVLGNFNAFYLPDDSGKILAEHSNVNTFRIIFNTYFNGNYEILEDKVIFDGQEITNWNEILGRVIG